jgi:hypothetical protein
LELIICNSVHYLGPIVNESDDDDDDKKNDNTQDSTNATTTTIASLKILGQPLIVRNVDIATRFMKIDTIRIPDKFPGVIRLIREKFPSINIHAFSDYDDDNDGGDIGGDNDNSNHTSTNTISSLSGDNTKDNEDKRIVIKKEDVIDSNHKRRTNSFVLPINSIIYYCHADNYNNNNNNNDLLTIIQLSIHGIF